jgi:hypothetical protein
MARAYTIATAALALGVPPKWLDNILSHYRILGVVQERQGVARRITIEGLLTIAVARILTAGLDIPVGRALEIAHEMLLSQGRVTSGSLKLDLDVIELRNRVIADLERAVEVAPLPRRGRPPKNTTGRLE